MTDQAPLDLDYETFVRRVRALAGVDLGGYKPDQMRRRLLALAGRHGAPTLTAFADLMAHDERALIAFKNTFTINVSEFLRDPARWDDLTSKVLPDLFARNGRRPLAIWSAGCSIGAEPYTLAMLLEEITPGVPHRILATDIDETTLARAAGGAGYSEADIRGLSPARREKYLVRDADSSYRVHTRIRARVQFRGHDLLTQPPGAGFDLIICRNVVIYFTEDAKRTLYARFHAALRPGGVLFVGGTEIVAGAREVGLEPVHTSFYRKALLRQAGAA